jgi:hypothetical protein
MKAIDNRLRNGIAHYKYEYNESTQVITYYPTKEGMDREKGKIFHLWSFCARPYYFFVRSIISIILLKLLFTIVF